MWSSGGRPWTKEFVNSILELNQVAAMFIFGKFHSGIEPLFLTVFPLETAVFYFWRLFWRRLCLICISPRLPWSWFFFFLFVFFSVHLYCSPGLECYKSHILFNLKQHTDIWPKTTLRPSTVGRHKMPFFMSKTAILSKSELQPYSYPWNSSRGRK